MYILLGSAKNITVHSMLSSQETLFFPKKQAQAFFWETGLRDSMRAEDVRWGGNLIRVQGREPMCQMLLFGTQNWNNKQLC